MAADLRDDVLAGIDERLNGIDTFDRHLGGRQVADLLDALRLLREDTERHRPCCGDPEKHDPYSEHDGPVWCSECSGVWPCYAIRSRARVYAPDALRERPDA